jgi:REP element-mobilizing transposase RayT
MYVNRFNRKRGFDYRRPGMYFVTINLHRHRRLFGKVVDGQMQLNELGQIAATCWQEIPQHFAHVRIDAWVIMPSHVHGILEITPTDASPFSRTPTTRKIIPAANAAGALGTIVGSYKAAVARQINLSTHCPHKPLWHRSFHDWIIRDSQHLWNTRRYIRNNPKVWGHCHQTPSRSSHVRDIPRTKE